MHMELKERLFQQNTSVLSISWTQYIIDIICLFPQKILIVLHIYIYIYVCMQNQSQVAIWQIFSVDLETAER